MKRLAIAAVLLATVFGVGVSENLPSNIELAVENREHSKAIDELQKLRIQNEKSFTDNNYDYLLARMAEADGQFAVAMTNYQAVVDRNTPLAPRALGHLSQIARSTGNLMLERFYLLQLSIYYPDSGIAAAAEQRVAKNNFESGNYGETIRMLTGGTTLTKKGTQKNDAAREEQALLGEAYMRNGQLQKAREMFTDLMSKTPNAAQPDDFALAAARGLDILDTGDEHFTKAPNLPEAESIKRANIYQFNRDFADARLHFEAIIANSPNGSNSPDSAFQIGRGLAQQGNYLEAVSWFERVLEQYPVSTTAKDALLQAASAYARVGKPKEAVKRYQQFIDKYPSDEKLDRAFLNIVDIERDQGNDSEALKWCGKTETAFRGKVPEALAVFAEVRIYVSKEDWPDAMAALERLKTVPDLGGVNSPGGTYQNEIGFLRGYVLEQQKRYAEAIDQYLSISDGRDEYYGGRATERLRDMAKDETANSFLTQKTGELAEELKSKDAETRRKNATSLLRISEHAETREKALAILKAAIKSLPKYAMPNTKAATSLAVVGRNGIAGELASLGLYDEAVEEMESAGSGGDTSLAAIYARGDRADRTMAFVEPLWKKVPADFPIELIPREQLELLYPAPYRDSLLKFAAPRGVDPRLLLAIMRQESRFDPDAKSFAAARGLMQFVSTTSRPVADELAISGFRQDELYYSPTAILFGSQYAADLFKAFPEQPAAVAASYNGGVDNMKRWLARSRSGLADRYVPEIIYSQSKDYVFKVMANYRMYKRLYNQDLSPA